MEMKNGLVVEMKAVPFLPLLVQYFQRRPEFTAAYLYGSYDEGVARPDSDVDIAVLTDPVPGNTLKYRLEVM